MTTRDFCDKHGACDEGREWALSTGQTMPEIWCRDDLDPEWRIWIATRPGVLDDRTSRLFACWCVRQVWHLLTDERSRNAIEVAERYANGDATKEDMSAARAAERAEMAAERAEMAARAARAARAAAMAAARAAARAAEEAAEGDAAWAAGEASAEDAARDAQAKWLRDNTRPNFD